MFSLLGGSALGGQDWIYLETCFHSVVFWFGDLNFRINDLEMQVVKSAIENNKLTALWEKDQVKWMSYVLNVIRGLHS